MPRPAPAELPAEVELFEQLRERIAVQRRLEPLDGAEPDRVDASAFGTIAATLEQAARFARVGETLPPFDHLGWARRALARLSGGVLLYFFRLVTGDQQRFNGLVVRALRSLTTTGRAVHRELHALPDDFVALLRARDQHLATHDNELATSDRRIAALEHAMAERDRRLSALEHAMAERDRQIADLEPAMAERDRQIAALEHATTTDLAAQRTAVADLRGASTVQRAQLDALQRRTAPAATAADAPQPRHSAAPLSPPPAADPLLEALVAAEVLRGSEAEIAARQQRYVGYFAGRRDVLDVGCGRGEFLERLRAADVPARGVDLDGDMVLRCREKGLDVACADALTYLAGLPNASLGGLFCAQVIEHWRTPVVVAFVHQAARTLAPGAPLVIETLNPESLLVIYRWFWLDVTHERLVHPDTLQYLLRAAGFEALQCVYAALPDGPLRIPLLQVAGADAAALQPFNAALQYLNDLLYGSYDYAVVACR